jgi:hypothetical protein
MTYDPGADAPEGPLDSADEDQWTDETAAEPEPERVRTGVERVDEVIRAVEELEERPIEEHVGVFEAAHSQLRRALDHQDEDDAVDPEGGEQAGPQGDAHPDSHGGE